MAQTIKVSRTRPASEGGGQLEQAFIHVPTGNDIEIYEDGALVHTVTGTDVEVRYSLEAAGGALAQSAVGADQAVAANERHVPVTERTGRVSGGR